LLVAWLSITSYNRHSVYTQQPEKGLRNNWLDIRLETKHKNFYFYSEEQFELTYD